MARPKVETKMIGFKIEVGVLEVLEEDSRRYGISKGAYISQLIMQKHIEMVATGLIEKLTPEQIQMSLDQVGKRSATEG